MGEDVEELAGLGGDQRAAANARRLVLRGG